MKRFSPPALPIKLLRRFLESLEHPKSKCDVFSKIVFPSVSLIVALIGAYTAWNAYQLSKDAFDLNVEPLLRSVVFTNSGFGPVIELQLYNEGINPVYDIHITRNWVIFDLDSGRGISQMRDTKDWHFVESLAPRDSSVFKIPKGDIDLIVHNADAEARVFKLQRSALIPVEVFDIGYRRLPDKRLYNQRRYLFFPTNYADSSVLFESDDDVFPNPFRHLESKLDSILAISEY
jgi:hypothetical protein